MMRFLKSRSLLLILGLALLLRLSFFVGFIHDYGEENIHLADAFRVMDGEPFAQFDYLRDGAFEGRKTDMVELYKFRPLVYLPSGLIMRFAGVSEWTLGAWFLLCSIGTVALVHRLALQYGERCALLAGVVQALVPLDVFWAGRINSDSVLTFFSCLSAWLLIAAPSAESRSIRLLRPLAAGAALGIAYLAKIVALVLLPLLLFLAIARVGWRRAALVLAAFLLLLAAEDLFYHRLTGTHLLHYRTAQGGILKNALEHFPMKPTFRSGSFTHHAYIEHPFFLNLLLGRTPDSLRNANFSYWGWAALGGFALLLQRRKATLPLLFVILYGYFEFGPSLIQARPDGIHYYQIFKEPKYFILLVPLVSIGAAVLLDRAIERIPRFGPFLFIGLGAVSVLDVRALHEACRPALSDLRRAAPYLADHHAETPVYTDALGGDVQLRLFSGGRLLRFREIRDGAVLQDGCLLLRGGTRGLNFSAAAMERIYASKLPILAGNLLTRRNPPFFEYIASFPADRAALSDSVLTVLRVRNSISRRPAPPHLEINLQRRHGELELNGFVQPQGEGNDVVMELHSDGELLRYNFLFPLHLPRSILSARSLRVVAIDAYGSRTERSLLLTRLQ